MNKTSLFKRLGKIAYSLSAAFMIVSLVLGALPAQAVLAVPGGGGSDCAHENTDGDADLCQDGTGQSGSWTAPSGYEIYDFVIKAGTEDFHGSVPGCYDVFLTATSVSWARVGDGRDCKEISHVEIYYRPGAPVIGCMDQAATNYNSLATQDTVPSSCVYPVIGCMDPAASNYNPLATQDTVPSSCVYPVIGCMDPAASNYNPLAVQDTVPSSCIYPVLGCMDPAATNYNPLATQDTTPTSCVYPQAMFNLTSMCRPDSTHGQMRIRNQSPVDYAYTLYRYGGTEVYTGTAPAGTDTLVVVPWYGSSNTWKLEIAGYTFTKAIGNNPLCSPVIGCMDQAATNYNPLATQDTVPSSCVYPVIGCMDQAASNYNPLATQDTVPSSCVYPVIGCMDQAASNYNPLATQDTVPSSCVYPVIGCMDPTAANYNPQATQDTTPSSCLYNVPVTLCHATASEQNPYNEVTVSVSSVDWWNQHGHGGHGDDIWAAFSIGGVVIPAQGDQAILANDCAPIPPEMILICNNNQTMEIPLQALPNYPDATLGACPAPAVPVAGLNCYSLESSTFHVTISNTGPEGEVGYYTNLDATIVSLGSMTAGGSAAVQIPGTATTLSLVAKLQTGWTEPVTVTLDKAELRACEEDPVGLSSFCSYVNPLYPNGWTVASHNTFAIEFTWAYGPESSAAPIPLAAQPAVVTFTTADHFGETMRIYSQGILLASGGAPAACPAFVPLTVTAFCAADPANFNAWRIANANAGEVGFEYNSAGGSGLGTVPAGSSVDITTPVLGGGDILALYSGGVLQASAAAATGCIPGEPPPGDNPPGNPTVLIPETAGTGTVLIPVTGLDAGAASRALPGTFFNLSLGLLGLGLVLSGLGRKRAG